eukprot:m.142383 g.142383  ORF g.142383 m.142383 type:complete len:87 (+) comp17136_c0_seq2:224-484(+)
MATKADDPFSASASIGRSTLTLAMSALGVSNAAEVYIRTFPIGAVPRVLSGPAKSFRQRVHDWLERKHVHNFLLFLVPTQDQSPDP